MYKEKYIKYKIKYFNLKSQLGGMPITYTTHIAPVHILRVNIAPDRTQKKDPIVPVHTQIKEAVEAADTAAVKKKAEIQRQADVAQRQANVAQRQAREAETAVALQTVANETTEAGIYKALTEITEAEISKALKPIS